MMAISLVPNRKMCPDRFLRRAVMFADASIPPGLLATSSSAQDKSDMPGEEGGKGFTLAPPGFYRSLCLLWGLGEGAELEGRIPLEVNLDLTRHISFSKGCYLGQELSARTKYKVRGCGLGESGTHGVLFSSNRDEVNGMVGRHLASKMLFLFLIL